MENSSRATASQPSIGGDTIDGRQTGFANGRVRKRCRVDDHGYVHTTHSEGLSDNTNDDHFAGSSLLSDQIFVGKLLTAYYQNIHPWIPILHEGRTRSRLLLVDESDRIHIILHAMLVAAYRFVEGEACPLPIQDMQKQANRSRDFVLLRAMENLTVENLQALIILAFTHVSTP